MYGLTLNNDLTILGNAFSTILNTYGINNLKSVITSNETTIEENSQVEVNNETANNTENIENSEGTENTIENEVVDENQTESP